jgi:hypothetical protein
LVRAASGNKAATGELLEKIRPELNLEKWPAIWRPAKSNRAPSARELRRETTLPNGNRVTAEVKVGFTDEGELTTEDRKTYYGLMKQWEDAGRTPQQTSFSIRGLSRTLRKKWGTNVIEAITESLRRLRTTPLTWTDSYEDGVKGETIRKIEIFNILSELKIVQREQDGVVNHAVGYFKFNDFILNNLLAHHTKPVLLDVIFGFKSEIAQLLYGHVDLLLAGRDHYERRSLELFEDLGLKGTEYRKPSQRKRKLEKALMELHGVRLSKGGILDVARLERTKDGKDYKVVFHRKAVRATAAAIEDTGEGELRFEIPVKPIIAVQAEEVVAHFHKLFHNVTLMHPQSKEVNHAVSLIASHGFDHAKYIVDFSHRAAARTNYSPQTFGGILQYATRAVADYERHQRDIEAATRTREAARARHLLETQEGKLQEQKRRDAEELLQGLPPEERQALQERMTADLLSRSPFLRSVEPNSTAFVSTVRRAMLTELMRDPHEPQNPPAQLS